MKSPSLFSRLFRRLEKEIASRFFLDQWIILVARGVDFDSLQWPAFRPLVPPGDRYWADPFIIQKGERYYVFIEEKRYAAGRGHIACLTLDEEGNLLEHGIALERPYHLSYPFLFEYEQTLYMLPESAAHRTLELYRCTRFPDEWQFVKTLMSGVYAVDATLLERDGKWWLFVNLKEQGGSSLNALHLFYADQPLAEHWTPHPRNPIVHDIRSARPAGRIFTAEAGLIRPSQDSSRRYGHALRFNRITKLTETEYQEQHLSTFAPKGGGMRAVHTFNRAGEMVVIDAVLRRRKSLETSEVSKTSEVFETSLPR